MVAERLQNDSKCLLVDYEEKLSDSERFKVTRPNISVSCFSFRCVVVEVIVREEGGLQAWVCFLYFLMTSWLKKKRYLVFLRVF